MKDAHSPNRQRQRSSWQAQFQLKTLMWLIAVIGAFLATLNALGAYNTLVIALLVFAVLCHVAGNAIGTRLRESGNRTARTENGPEINARQRGKVHASDCAPTTRLSSRTKLGWVLVANIAFGSLVGGLYGCYLFAYDGAEKSSPATIAVGSASFAVLGGILGFMVGSFLQVGIGALRQALKDPSAARSNHR